MTWWSHLHQNIHRSRFSLNVSHCVSIPASVGSLRRITRVSCRVVPRAWTHGIRKRAWWDSHFLVRANKELSTIFRSINATINLWPAKLVHGLSEFNLTAKIGLKIMAEGGLFIGHLFIELYFKALSWHAWRQLKSQINKMISALIFHRRV